MISQENFETSFSSQHSAGEEQVKKEPTEKHARHSAASESSNLKDIQSIFSASGGLTEIELDQQQHQRLTLSVLHFNSISSLTWFTGEAIGHIMENNPKSLWMRLWYPSSFIIAIWIIKLRIKYAGCKFSEKFASIILQFLMMYSVIEGQYYMHPEKFEITPGVLLFIGQQQFFDLSMVTSLTQKNIKRAILWAIYYARNLQLYQKMPDGFIGCLVVMCLMQNLSGKIYDNYIGRIKSQTGQITQMFCNTLDLVPNGVLLINTKTQTISFANKEMEKIIRNSSPTLESKSGSRDDFLLLLKDKLKACFYLKSSPTTQSTPQTRESDVFANTLLEKRRSFAGRKLNSAPELVITQNKGGANKMKKSLWNYLINSKFDKETEEIFKSKEPRRYLQVKCQPIGEGSQIMAICTDITRIIEIEEQNIQMRSSFFSSVAHELRTPLNSVIPILRMIQGILANAGKQLLNVEKLTTFVNIALSSSLHLENVIEDALDISRLENNKFQIFKETFDIRSIVCHVVDVMRFQIEQKGVKITHQISERVPDQISSDQKRLKQVLFNLLGNANKFTFEGQISVNVDYKPFSNRLIFKIKDTGVGIHKEDLNKLFKFFGTLASTKNINKGGMGLGLTISKMIIQQLGGEVAVKSEPSVGTEFEFWIPLHQEGLGGFKDLDQLSPERILNEKFSFHSKRHSMRDDSNNKTGLLMRRATKQIKKQSFLELPSELNVVQITANKSEVSDVINFTDLSNPLEGGDNIPHFSHGIHDKYQLLKAQTCQIPPVFINSTAQLQAHRLKEQSSTLLTFKQQTQSSRQFTSQKHTLRILCVDDSTYNLFVLQELLIVYATDACHIEVDTAISGQLALGKVKECLQQEGKAAHMYDLILLDLHMPIMDGFQTAQEIRQLIASNERWINKARNLHIIAVSAITRQQFMQSDQADIFDDFLEKPINIEALRKYLSTYEENRTAEGFW